MSPPNKNGLVRKIQKLFFFKPINVRPIYFYQWTVDEYRQLLNSYPKLFEEYALYSNGGHKDIIIDEGIQPIFHLVKHTHAAQNLPNQQPYEMLEQQSVAEFHPPLIMLATVKPLLPEQIEVNSIGTIVSTANIDIEDIHFSSLEI